MSFPDLDSTSCWKYSSHGNVVDVKLNVNVLSVWSSLIPRVKFCSPCAYHWYLFLRYLLQGSLPPLIRTDDSLVVCHLPLHPPVFPSQLPSRLNLFSTSMNYSYPWTKKRNRELDWVKTAESVDFVNNLMDGDTGVQCSGRAVLEVMDVKCTE